MYKADLEYQDRFYLLSRIILILIIFTTTQSYSFSQNMPVPENIQAALLPKVLKYSSNLSQKSKIRILIVYDNNSQTSKDEFTRELRISMDVKAVLASELEKNISGCDLVYFMPGIQNLAAICKTYRVLSVTGISQYVEQGQVSLAFGIQNNKPKIFVNLSSLENEGQSLSSEILRIAKVYN